MGVQITAGILAKEPEREPTAVTQIRLAGHNANVQYWMLGTKTTFISVIETHFYHSGVRVMIHQELKEKC